MDVWVSVEKKEKKIRENKRREEKRKGVGADRVRQEIPHYCSIHRRGDQSIAFHLATETYKLARRTHAEMCRSLYIYMDVPGCFSCRVMVCDRHVNANSEL